MEINYILIFFSSLEVWPIKPALAPWQGKWWRPQWTWGSRGRPNRWSAPEWRGARAAAVRDAGTRNLAGAWLAWGTASSSPKTEQNRETLVKSTEGIVHPKIRTCWKCPRSQAVQDVDEFVSLSEQIWRNVALHHLLTNGSSAVNGCRQNESPNSW